MSNRRQAVHIHIPKCGGTTVTRYLQNLLGKSRVAHYGRREQTAEFRRMQPAEFGRYRAVGGHIPYEMLRSKMGGDPLYFAIVRDPYDLFVSFYQDVAHRESHPLHKDAKRMRPTEFLEFASSNDLLRPQLFYFDRGCSFEQAARLVEAKLIRVDTLERMNTLLAEIAKYFDRPHIDLPHSNKSKTIALNDADKIRDHIESLYPGDRRFFEYISSRADASA